jgi:hypothetical protein
MKYIIIAKWLSSKEIEKLQEDISKGNWDIMLTNCTVVFERINDDFTTIKLVE